MSFGNQEDPMPKKRHKPEEIVAKLRQVDVLAPRGQSAADAVRATGVMEVTYYRGRQDYGVLKPDQMKWLKDLEAKKTRLHRAVSDSTIDKMILEEAAKGPAAEGRLQGFNNRIPDILCRVGRAVAPSGLTDCSRECELHHFIQREIKYPGPRDGAS
jgi:putative transposase